MYSCYDSYVMYGVMEGDRNMALDSSWLEEHFPEFATYASDIVRNHHGNAVYGICVGMCQETGQAIASDEEKESVQKLYTLLCEYCEKSGHEKLRLGYFLVVSGDYESDQEEYVPTHNEYHKEIANVGSSMQELLNVTNKHTEMLDYLMTKAHPT